MKKIKHPLVKGVVKEIVPRIYCATVDDDYDRAMLFPALLHKIYQ